MLVETEEFNTGRKKTSYKYNIEMLKVEETKDRFQLTISNNYQVLASLQENEEHLSEGKDQTAVKQLWQGVKDAWRETCEDTLGRKSKQHRAFASLDTLNKIEVRKKAKEVLNCSKTRVRNQKLRPNTPEPRRRLNEALDRRDFVNSLAKQAEEAAGKGGMKEFYSITRTLAGAKKIPDRPVRSKIRECSPTKRSSEKGGQTTSGSCLTDPRRARFPT